jgi:hypothetical protein
MPVISDMPPAAQIAGSTRPASEASAANAPLLKDSKTVAAMAKKIPVVLIGLLLV